MCIHLRLNNESDTISTISASPSQGQDVYVTHKNICRDSMYIEDVTKTASPPNPLFAHSHIHIPLHFRSTPFSLSLLPIAQEH